MAVQNQPNRIPRPFAASGTKNSIPDTNTSPSASQAASWTSGFPEECSRPLSAGGCPVPRNDFNGILNQLSQDAAFHQDGGVWTWSALADYNVQRLVRGSDGTLYWSVAQSGPSFGGAQDPTLGGSAWSTLPVLTPKPADSSNKAATTEWVRSFAGASVYVSPSGSDSNDGMSAAKPVKTFAKAFSIGAERSLNDVAINAAGGSYSEDIVLIHKNCKIILSGDISISGRIYLGNMSFMSITGGHKTTIAYSGASNAALQLVDASTFIAGELQIVADGLTSTAVSVGNGSSLVLSNLSISGQGCANGISASARSVVYISGAFSIDDMVGSGYAIDAVSSCLILGGASTVHSSSSKPAMRIANQAYFSCSNITVYLKSSSTGIEVTACSVALMAGISIDAAASASSFLSVSSTAYCFLGGNVAFNGTVSSAAVYVIANAVLNIDAAASISGTVSGARYAVKAGGFINVHGAGANRIPGTSSGSADASQFALYL